MFSDVEVSFPFNENPCSCDLQKHPHELNITSIFQGEQIHPVSAQNYYRNKVPGDTTLQKAVP